ncbi:MAG: hypothetical protein OEZ59_02420 [Deltaproteobacteria bacterium]|nr:hypothetical protein [Deltaproteobacteria bacterium]
MLLVAVLPIISTLSPSAQARGDTFSLRYAGGPEVELHLGKVGLMYTYHAGRAYREDKKGATPACEAQYDTSHISARFFFSGPKDSWYLGATTRSHRLASDQPCAKEPEGGISPMLGYHWLWSSGFNFDLGFRPNFFALGLTF